MAARYNSSMTVAEIAKEVIVTTAERAIPLTPENYHVWFEYFSGENNELKDFINELITSRNCFSQEISENIYNEFINGNKKAILQEAHKETHRIFKHIIKTTLSSSNLTSIYGANLEMYSNKLDIAEDFKQIQDVIVCIMNDTNDMAESSKNLNQQLKEATLQIQRLSKQLEETEREILKDALTQLNNRKAFDNKIQELFENYTKTKEPFSIIMLDVDFFKNFNDQYGHQIGDEVLYLFGTILKQILKGKDFPARYGGEEFIILLPNTTIDNTVVVAETIREEISKNRLKIKKTGQRIGNITVSAGVSVLNNNDSPITVIERADAALYLAKSSGRNNVKSEKDLKYTSTLN